jgi:hypothetical protein
MFLQQVGAQQRGSGFTEVGEEGGNVGLNPLLA